MNILVCAIYVTVRRTIRELKTTKMNEQSSDQANNRLSDNVGVIKTINCCDEDILPILFHSRYNPTLTY